MIFPHEFRTGFTVHGVQNARYAADTRDCIIADVDWGQGFQEYAISPRDPEPWGLALFEHCLEGEVAEYTGPSSETIEAKYALEIQKEEDAAELADLMIDIQLGLATPEEIERAKELRLKLKG